MFFMRNQVVEAEVALVGATSVVNQPSEGTNALRTLDYADVLT
jgi:hypothetical protein